MDRRGLIFKLCRRDLVQVIFNACKRTKPSFYVNCSLTPTRNKVFYVLRQLKKKFPGLVKSCRALNGDVVAFVAQTRAQADSAPATEEDEKESGAHESDDVNGRNRKMVINSREDLIKFASYVLNTNVNGFHVTW